MDSEDVIERKKCTGCMACMNICPKNAIKIEEGKDGFSIPKINSKDCIKCGLCKKVCPVMNKLSESINEVEVYACKNNSENTRLRSSSGGIFTLIAEWILEENGVVFGARFNENMELIHDYAETSEELKYFRGSKYLQSNISDIYQKVKVFLDAKRKVLFTGTPCQVEGLIAYLGKEYENLYTQDIICHGVPSPKVWRKYIEYIEQQKGEKLKRINFRNKNITGWSNYQVHYEYVNMQEDIEHEDDVYMQLFLKNFDLRKSCYQCQFKKINRKADITLADFWGINEIDKKFNDEKGISAIIIHSKKGKELFENIKNNIEFLKDNIENIMKYNSCVYKSTSYNYKREEFFEDLDKEEFKVLIEKYL